MASAARALPGSTTSAARMGLARHGMGAAGRIRHRKLGVQARGQHPAIKVLHQRRFAAEAFAQPVMSIQMPSGGSGAATGE
jgi:hypothetical protein